MLKHNANREAILHQLEEAGGLNEENVAKISSTTGVPEADIWGAGTFYSLVRKPGKRLRICDGLTCQMLGADKLMQLAETESIEWEPVSCLGQCDRAPVQLNFELQVQSFSKQHRSLTANDINLPINLGGECDVSFSGLRIAMTRSRESILNEIQESGLQGRGGAGFPAHLKWRSVASQTETQRYVVCNADEGEPGTFKDREVMLRQPGKLLDGLAVAAYTVQAKDIYLYIRGEFSAERKSVEKVLSQTLQDPDHPLHQFEFHFVNGHGAYICGEETALLESLEGQRGMPRMKPPFPTVAGFRGKPTLMHNVETSACVPSILQNGGAWFKQQGRTEPGTKLYCISGHVLRPGVYELPLGITLAELVAEAGGFDGTPVAFSPGGASSGFLPMSYSDVPLDYSHLNQIDSMLGSAGIVVLNDSVDLKQAALWQLKFFERESCGQCAPCRLGTQFVRQRTEAFLKGEETNWELVSDVAWEMEEGSICGLGMVAAKPLMSLRKHFPQLF